MEELKPKNYHFEGVTKAAQMNAPLYVFTPLRDLETNSMGICFPKLPRCTLKLVETFPRYAPSHAALIEGQLIIEERMIAAQLQVSTLQEAFGREGLTAIDCDYPVAVTINKYLDQVRDLSFNAAIQWINENVKDIDIRNILLKSFQDAKAYALGVLQTTRKEFQNAHSGRAGKSYIDDRDSLFAALSDITELSLISPEGAASANTTNTLVSQLASAFGNSDSNTKILALLESQANQIAELQAKLAEKK